MNNTVLGVSLALFANLVAAVSQILLKKASAKNYKPWWRSYLNFLTIFGYGLLFVTVFINMIAMKNIQVVLAAALATSGQIFVPVLSRIFLKEAISRRRIVGMSIIIVGIFLFSLEF